MRFVRPPRPNSTEATHRPCSAFVRILSYHRSLSRQNPKFCGMIRQSYGPSPLQQVRAIISTSRYRHSRYNSMKWLLLHGVAWRCIGAHLHIDAEVTALPAPEGHYTKQIPNVNYNPDRNPFSHDANGENGASVT